MLRGDAAAKRCPGEDAARSFRTAFTSARTEVVSARNRIVSFAASMSGAPSLSSAQFSSSSLPSQTLLAQLLRIMRSKTLPMEPLTAIELTRSSGIRL